MRAVMEKHNNKSLFRGRAQRGIHLMPGKGKMDSCLGLA